MDQAPPTSTGKLDHPGIYCDGCFEIIQGYRYKCLECENFDLCKSCESDYHSGHVICRFTAPMTESEKKFLKIISDRRPDDKPFLIQGFHDGEKCNVCNREHVEGFLYKCCDCEFNACRRCEKKESVCLGGKNHSLFRFADPLNLNSFNKRFWKEILEIRSTMRKPHIFSENFISESTIHNGTKCNICYNHVVGLRYKCIDCKEFDLCAACETKNVHQGHLLVRFGRPIESEMKLFYSKIVRLRMSINSRSFTTDTRSEWTSNDYRIKCTNCESTIHGYRYKCLDCMDFDLCSFCQKKESHTEHGMVRLTEPLSQNKLNQSFVEAVMKSKQPKSIPMLSRATYRPKMLGISEDYISHDYQFTSNFDEISGGLWPSVHLL